VLGVSSPTKSAQETSVLVPGRLEELAKIGNDPNGGVTRLPFTPEELEAVALFTHWAGEAGARVVRDEFGSVFAFLGEWEEAPGIMLGSHLDTVPSGGAYDGALGVVAGLSVLQSWREETPLCVAAFRAEEATLSPIGRLGSSVYCGALSAGEALAAVERASDAELSELDVMQVSPPRFYLELHIEQGGTLEASGLSIGVVIGIAGYTRFRIEIVGRPDHVGSTPMGMRRDALAAAAELVLEVEQLGLHTADVATVSQLDLFPGAMGIVPSRVGMTADIRSIADAERTRAGERLRETARTVADRRNVEVTIKPVATAPSVRFPESIIAAVESAAEVTGGSSKRIASGANHDAGNMAALCPTGMIFVPSVDGRSHTPDEYTAPEDCQNGALTLAVAAQSLAASNP
jgi:hydantoinase/carbamoylase family amidase